MKVVAHSGSLPGISTFSLMLPDKKTGVIVLTNLAGGRAGSIAEEPASDLLGRSLFGETGGGSLSFRTRYPVPAAGRLARYGGAYMFEQARLEVVPGEGGIDITHPVSEYTDEKVTSRLVAVADDTFMGRQEDGLAQVVCFVRGPDGQINGLLTGGNRLGRV